MTRRKLDKHRSPAGKIPAHAWEQEQARLEQEYKAEYEQYKPIEDDLRRLQQVKRNADTALHQQEQTRQKRREAERGNVKACYLTRPNVSAKLTLTWRRSAPSP